MVFPNGKLIFQIPTHLLNPYTLQSNKDFHYAAAKMHRKAQYIAYAVRRKAQTAAMRSPQDKAQTAAMCSPQKSADRPSKYKRNKPRLDRFSSPLYALTSHSAYTTCLAPETPATTVTIARGSPLATAMNLPGFPYRVS